MDLVNILRGIFNPQKQSTISSKDLPNVATSPKEQETLRRIGVTTTDLNKAVQQMLYVGQDRRSVYTAAENSLEEPIMSGSVSLYADTSAGKSNSNNKSIWAESKSKEYKYQIDKLFDIINIEEILYDITWSTCLYGDHFIRVNGQPGVGVTSIEDDDHPLNFNRVDVNGRLVGFFETQMGMSPASTTELLPPWSVVHFRLLGAKRKRPLYSTGLDYTSSSEYRAINLVTPGERRISSKYGVSVLNDALIAYKRYKMCKDSLMLTRLSKGQLRYIYSIGVGNNASAEAVASILDEMGEVLKKARCLSGETEISLLDSTTPTIKEMAEQSEKYIGKYIFSINPITKAIEPDKIVDVRKTLINTEVIRVHLDNKQYIDCTPDHRFMLRDGTYKEAQHLKSGESLMPLYTKNILGRRLVFNPSISKYEYIYQNVAKFILGKTPKNYIIHHKDCTKFNDDPSNLEFKSRSEHLIIHDIELHKRKKFGFIKNRIPWNKGLTKETNESLQRVSKNISKTQKIQFSLGLRTVWNKGLTKETNTGMLKVSQRKLGQKRTLQSIKKQKETRKKNYLLGKRYLRVEREYRLCKCGCGETFECLKTSKKQFIGQHCQNSIYSNFYGPMPVERKKKIGLSNTGKIRTPELKAHFSRIRKGVKQKPESILHRSIGLKKTWKRYKENNIPWKKSLQNTLEVVNHKVVRIEYLPYTQDTYDITTERNHNFALTNGVFVHNSIDISAANPNAFKDRMNYLSNVEDIIIPVWGDVNQFKVDKIGENPDVKWIRDIDELRQDLFASLRVAPQLLGAYMAEMPSGMGDNTLERLDIRFARQCKRIQKTLLSGIERLIQIHLAYQGLDPDLNQFEVKIAEISSAEEEELKNGLKTGTESVSTFVETLENMFGEKLDRVKLMKYINEKFLKLNDFNIEDMLLDLKQVGPLMATGPTPETEEGANQPAATTETPRAVSEPPVTGGNPFRSALNARVDNSDLKSMLPIHEARWKELYGETKIKITEG